MPLGKALPPLLVLATLTALFISRTSLVAHEFVGHGGVAKAFGGAITDHHLFVFGGGRIHYELDARASWTATLFISMGGIAVELVLGAIALVVARRASNDVARFVAVAFASSVFVHALYYLVDGTHYGYGDARPIYVALGVHRPWLVVPGAIALCAGAWLVGRSFARTVDVWLDPRTRTRRIALVASMVAVGGGVHFALMRVELATSPDDTYAKIFRSEANERAKAIAERELAERLRDRPSDAERARLLEELAAKNRPFPLRAPLVAAMIACALSALWRGDRSSGTPAPARPIRWRDVARVGALTASALAMVLALRAPW